MKVFISYRRSDSNDAAHAVYRYLTTKHGKANTFIDVDTISKGVEFDTALAKAISKTDVVLALIGPRWLEVSSNRMESRLFEPDDFVHREIALAINQGLPVIPLLIGDAQRPLPSQVPKDIIRIWRNRPFFLRDASDLGELEQLNSRILRLARRLRPSRWFLYGAAIAAVFLLLTIPTLLIPLRAIEQSDTFVGNPATTVSVFVFITNDNKYILDGKRIGFDDIPMYVTDNCLRQGKHLINPCGYDTTKVVILPSESTKPELIISLVQALEKHRFFRVVLGVPAKKTE